MSVIEDAVIALIKEQRFYANLILNMVRHETDKIPTAGVNIDKNRIHLYVNPQFWKDLKLSEQKAILIHECLHILHNHIGRYKNIQKEDKLLNDFQIMNIAADVSINQFIRGIPEKMQISDMHGKKHEGEAATFKKLKEQFPEIQEKMHAEYYYDYIKKNAPKEEKSQMGQSVDDHGIWNEGDASESDVDDIIKRNVEEAYERSKGVGNISSDLELLINNLLKSNVNWKVALRTFMQNSVESYRVYSRKKRNRRYGLLYPGARKFPKLNIGIAVDTSGSISDNELQLFFTEISKIYTDLNGQINITIMEADSSIKQIYEYDPKNKIEVKGRGGTEYQPALDKAAELKLDGLIYFGDGDIYGEQLIKPKYPILWAMVRGNNPPAKWGKVIQIENE